MFAFLLSAVAISLSGVMAPGPMTAATVAAGARWRHAGLGIAVGHAVVELPLMLLILGGVGRLLKLPHVQAILALVGGLFLAFLGVQLLLSARRRRDVAPPQRIGGPVWTGIALTAANPYFLLWWATIGLALATEAWGFGLGVFIAFAVLHWLCDLVWLEVLSVASHGGSRLLGGAAERIIALVCGVALAGFAVKFLYDAAVHFAQSAGSV